MGGGITAWHTTNIWTASFSQQPFIKCLEGAGHLLGMAVKKVNEYLAFSGRKHDKPKQASKQAGQLIRKGLERKRNGLGWVYG